MSGGPLNLRKNVVLFIVNTIVKSRQNCLEEMKNRTCVIGVKAETSKNGFEREFSRVLPECSSGLRNQVHACAERLSVQTILAPFDTLPRGKYACVVVKYVLCKGIVLV